MLENDPPAGTKVRFLKTVRKAQESDVGSLIRASRKYDREDPKDLFYVQFGGDEILVYRDEIEKL